MNDRKEGWGEMCWKSGSFYKGEWKAGLREGWGVHHFHNGDKYVGSWARDKRMGKGELQFANGDKFEGEWIEDKKHGKGKGAFFFASFLSSKPNSSEWAQGLTFMLMGGSDTRLGRMELKLRAPHRCLLYNLFWCCV